MSPDSALTVEAVEFHLFGARQATKDHLDFKKGFSIFCGQIFLLFRGKVFHAELKLEHLLQTDVLDVQRKSLPCRIETRAYPVPETKNRKIIVEISLLETGARIHARKGTR